MLVLVLGWGLGQPHPNSRLSSIPPNQLVLMTVLTQLTLCTHNLHCLRVAGHAECVAAATGFSCSSLWWLVMLRTEQLGRLM